MRLKPSSLVVKFRDKTISQKYVRYEWKGVDPKGDSLSSQVGGDLSSS